MILHFSFLQQLFQFKNVITCLLKRIGPNFTAFSDFVADLMWCGSPVEGKVRCSAEECAELRRDKSERVGNHS
jgi:hypothetical protein